MSKDTILIGLPIVLAVLFVILKLYNIIDWSWWFVVSPLWIPSVALASAAVLVGLWYTLKIVFELIYEKMHSEDELS